MKKRDALWLLALPLYLLIGTARHELSHAAAAHLQGARITHIRLFPSIDPEIGLIWGRVGHEGGNVTWVTTAAPYFFDVATFAVFLFICMWAPRMPRWLWINCFIIGLVSPLVDVVYNYQKVFWSPHGDVPRLAMHFSPMLIHAVFLPVIALFAAGIVMALRVFSRASRESADDCHQHDEHEL